MESCKRHNGDNVNMIDPTDSLAFSIQANRGVYALLIGLRCVQGCSDSDGLGHNA